MIKYSTQPGKGAKALKNDSPSSPIITTRDTKGLNNEGLPGENVTSALDLDADDVNE